MGYPIGPWEQHIEKIDSKKQRIKKKRRTPTEPNTAWAFAAMGQLDEALFAALARAAEPRLNEFNAQHFANAAWAFATAARSDEVLFAASAMLWEACLDGVVGVCDGSSFGYVSVCGVGRGQFVLLWRVHILFAQ